MASLSVFADGMARFLAVFGLSAVLTMLPVGIAKATIVSDVLDEAETFRTPGDPATSGDQEVRKKWSDAQTINGLEQSLRFLGLGSILGAIFLTFSVVVFRGVSLLRHAMPALWNAYLTPRTGRQVQLVQAEA